MNLTSTFRLPLSYLPAVYSHYYRENNKQFVYPVLCRRMSSAGDGTVTFRAHHPRVPLFCDHFAGRDLVNRVYDFITQERIANKALTECFYPNVVITGPSGTGKSTLVRSLVQTYGDQYCDSVWINGYSTDTVSTCLSVFRARSRPGLDRKKVAEAEGFGDAIGALYFSSDNTPPKPVLLVFDHVSRVHRMDSSFWIHQYLEAIPQGCMVHVIITSQHSQWRGQWNEVPMEQMSKDESLELLRGEDEPAWSSDERVEQVATLLHGFPLGLVVCRSLLRHTEDPSLVLKAIETPLTSEEKVAQYLPYPHSTCFFRLLHMCLSKVCSKNKEQAMRLLYCLCLYFPNETTAQAVLDFSMRMKSEESGEYPRKRTYQSSGEVHCVGNGRALPDALDALYDPDLSEATVHHDLSEGTNFEALDDVLQSAKPLADVGIVQLEHEASEIGADQTKLALCDVVRVMVILCSRELGLPPGPDLFPIPLRPPVKHLDMCPRPSRIFVGREEIFNRIHDSLSTSPWVPVALVGFPGIGKTETAKHYAVNFFPHHQNVAWLDATSRETLNFSFRAIATALKILPTSSDDDVGALKEIVERVYRHFSHHLRSGLFVFDNALEMARNPTACEEFLPPTWRPYAPLTLLTLPRVTEEETRYRIIVLEELGSIETRSFFLDLFGLDQGEAGMDKLAELSNLSSLSHGYPLAIAAAASNVKHICHRQTLWNVRRTMKRMAEKLRTSAIFDLSPDARVLFSTSATKTLRELFDDFLEEIRDLHPRGENFLKCLCDLPANNDEVDMRELELRMQSTNAHGGTARDSLGKELCNELLQTLSASHAIKITEEKTIRIPHFLRRYIRAKIATEPGDTPGFAESTTDGVMAEHVGPNQQIDSPELSDLQSETSSEADETVVTEAVEGGLEETAGETDEIRTVATISSNGNEHATSANQNSSLGPTGTLVRSKIFRMVPSAVEGFVGREKDMQAIRKHFEKTTKGCSHYTKRVVAIQGPPGIGKSRLAIKFASEYSETFPRVALLHAETESSLQESFLELGRMLELVPSECKEYPTGLDKRIYRHIDGNLQSCGHFLLIFDDVLQVKAEEGSFGISEYLPTEELPNQGYPFILITTQVANLDSNFTVHHLDRLDEEPSLKFFHDNFKLKPQDCQEVLKSLHEYLKGYPLAMTLVANAIADSWKLGYTKGTQEHTRPQLLLYLNTVSKYQDQALKGKAYSFSSDYDTSIQFLWRITLETLRRQDSSGLALELLKILSLLRPGQDVKNVCRIHETPFKSSKNYLSGYSPSDELLDSLNLLEKLSLITIYHDKMSSNGIVYIQRWLQPVARAQLDCTTAVKKILLSSIELGAQDSLSELAILPIENLLKYLVEQKNSPAVPLLAFYSVVYRYNGITRALLHQLREFADSSHYVARICLVACVKHVMVIRKFDTSTTDAERQWEDIMGKVIVELSDPRVGTGTESGYRSFLQIAVGGTLQSLWHSLTREPSQDLDNGVLNLMMSLSSPVFIPTRNSREVMLSSIEFLRWVYSRLKARKIGLEPTMKGMAKEYAVVILRVIEMVLRYVPPPTDNHGANTDLESENPWNQFWNAVLKLCLPRRNQPFKSLRENAVLDEIRELLWEDSVFYNEKYFQNGLWSFLKTSLTALDSYANGQPEMDKINELPFYWQTTPGIRRLPPSESFTPIFVLLQYGCRYHLKQLMPKALENLLKTFTQLLDSIVLNVMTRTWGDEHCCSDASADACGGLNREYCARITAHAVSFLLLWFEMAVMNADAGIVSRVARQQIDELGSRLTKLLAKVSLDSVTKSIMIDLIHRIERLYWPSIGLCLHNYLLKYGESTDYPLKKLSAMSKDVSDYGSFYGQSDPEAFKCYCNYIPLRIYIDVISEPLKTEVQKLAERIQWEQGGVEAKTLLGFISSLGSYNDIPFEDLRELTSAAGVKFGVAAAVRLLSKYCLVSYRQKVSGITSVRIHWTVQEIVREQFDFCNQLAHILKKIMSARDAERFLLLTNALTAKKHLCGEAVVLYVLACVLLYEKCAKGTHSSDAVLSCLRSNPANGQPVYQALFQVAEALWSKDANDKNVLCKWGSLLQDSQRYEEQLLMKEATLKGFSCWLSICSESFLEGEAALQALELGLAAFPNAVFDTEEEAGVVARLIKATFSMIKLNIDKVKVPQSSGAVSRLLAMLTPFLQHLRNSCKHLFWDEFAVMLRTSAGGWNSLEQCAVPTVTIKSMHQELLKYFGYYGSRECQDQELATFLVYKMRSPLYILLSMRHSWEQQRKEGVKAFILPALKSLHHAVVKGFSVNDQRPGKAGSIHFLLALIFCTSCEVFEEDEQLSSYLSNTNTTILAQIAQQQVPGLHNSNYECKLLGDSEMQGLLEIGQGFDGPCGGGTIGLLQEFLRNHSESKLPRVKMLVDAAEQLYEMLQTHIKRTEQWRTEREAQMRALKENLEYYSKLEPDTKRDLLQLPSQKT